MKNPRLDDIAHEVAQQVEDCISAEFGENFDFDFAGAKAAIRAGIHRYLSGNTSLEECVIQKIITRNPDSRTSIAKFPTHNEDLLQLQEELIHSVLTIEKQLQSK